MYFDHNLVHDIYPPTSPSNTMNQFMIIWTISTHDLNDEQWKSEKQKKKTYIYQTSTMYTVHSSDMIISPQKKSKPYWLVVRNMFSFPSIGSNDPN